jgi:hypothetical protein
VQSPEYVVNVEASLCRINTLYPVIAEPPLAGATQTILTVVPDKTIEVAGAAGIQGAVGRAAPT